MRFFSPKITFAVKAGDGSIHGGVGRRPGHQRVIVCAFGGRSGGKQQWQKHPWLWGLGGGAWRNEWGGDQLLFLSKRPSRSTGEGRKLFIVTQSVVCGPDVSAGSLGNMQGLKHSSRRTGSESALEQDSHSSSRGTALLRKPLFPPSRPPKHPSPGLCYCSVPS